MVIHPAHLYTCYFVPSCLTQYPWDQELCVYCLSRLCSRLLGESQEVFFPSCKCVLLFVPSLRHLREFSPLDHAIRSLSRTPLVTRSFLHRARIHHVTREAAVGYLIRQLQTPWKNFGPEESSVAR